MKKILLITLVVFTMFITLITKSNSANALEPSGRTFTLKDSFETEWVEEDHGKAQKSNKGDKYYSVKFYYEMDESDDRIDNYVIDWAYDYVYMAHTGSFHLSKGSSITTGYTVSTSVTATVSDTISSSCTKEFSAEIGLSDIVKISPKVETEVSNSITTSLSETYSTSTSQAVTCSISGDYDVINDYEPGWICGFYTIQAVQLRYRLVKIEYRCYECKKNGCNYEWVPGKIETKKCDIITGYAYAPSDRWYKNGKRIGHYFYSWPNLDSLYDFAENIGK